MPEPRPIDRTVVDNVLDSPALPAFRLGVDPSVPYLGHTTLVIKGIARAERHHFADVREGRVRRLLVAQFEGFLPDNDERYQYALPDQVDLGDDIWGSWVFCYSAHRDDPEPETTDTLAFLGGKDIELDDEQIMARYARILSEDARNEVLLFYHEPLRRLGYRLATIAADGDLLPRYASVGIELQARARRAFRISPR
jgi:hypothetical protein